MIDVVMPQLGEDVTEATVQQWQVQEGSYVKLEQNLLVVSTDKADIEIPSPCDGRVVEIVAPVGAKVPKEGLLARIDDTAT
jgi:2-oxoglutarate dehydrogenase E2 component (dihydrolipoamide succinyltransferase)